MCCVCGSGVCVGRVCMLLVGVYIESDNFTGASAAAIQAARSVLSTLSCKSSKRRGYVLARIHTHTHTYTIQDTDTYINMFYFSRNSRSQSQQDDLGDLPSRRGVGTADSGDWKEVQIKVILCEFFAN